MIKERLIMITMIQSWSGDSVNVCKIKTKSDIKQRINPKKAIQYTLSVWCLSFKLSPFTVTKIMINPILLELGWKTMKDYLELEGFDVKTPRSAIQTAFQVELIRDGHIWIDMLNKQNLMAHTYNEQFALEAECLI